MSPGPDHAASPAAGALQGRLAGVEAAGGGGEAALPRAGWRPHALGVGLVRGQRGHPLPRDVTTTRNAQL